MSETLGTGAHRYELVPDWGTLPPSVRYGYTHGVQVDAQGRVIIHNMSDNAVIFFDGKGKFIKSWGKEYAAGAHGMQLGKENGAEFLVFCDIARRLVIKSTLDGKVIWTISCPKEAGVYEDPQHFVPTNVALAPNGDVYVADGYGRSYIHQFNKDAKYIRTWGGSGSEPGKLNGPHGIWVDTRTPTHQIIVADRENNRLQMFTLDGKHIGFVTEELRRPCHFDQRGTDLLIPDLHSRVTIFDKNNKLVTHLGDRPDAWKIPGWPNLPRDQWIAGKFSTPHAACWDHDGNIYVVEWIEVGRVTKLRRLS